MSVNNGLGDLPRLTQTSVRSAVASSVADTRNGWSDQEMADEWGVSASTVNNAQNKKHDLALMNWLMLGSRFGPESLNAVLAIVGMKAVRLGAVIIDVATVPLKIAQALPLLIKLLADGECCDRDMRELEEAGAVEAILNTADYLRQRRNEVQTKEGKD